MPVSRTGDCLRLNIKLSGQCFYQCLCSGYLKLRCRKIQAGRNNTNMDCLAGTPLARSNLLPPEFRTLYLPVKSVGTVIDYEMIACGIIMVVYRDTVPFACKYRWVRPNNLFDRVQIVIVGKAECAGRDWAVFQKL